eukprot:XP_011601704.1 PREDICTED: microcephalin [Takifugu rubripes]
MTTGCNSSVLKDVVGYVDVWSADKTANCSKPFIKQLQEMGAQVSKTFTKQVTHVVFKNGHPATWRKAKKREVKLVSVLWVGRCHEEGVLVSEELYPAVDETNPLLKNKKHRCMQPKDSPERTPENDRRMRRKLDKMMKDLVPKRPIVTDVSPIIIDQESGIVYSPGLKRSDYMAQRLKAMKEKRENLSPTASQMIESSPTGIKPSLGSTPTGTHWNSQFKQSDDDSSTSVDEPAYSPKEEGRKPNVTEHDNEDQHQRKTSVKLCSSAIRDVPRCIPSPLKCPDFSNLEDNDGNTPVENQAGEQTQKSRAFSDSTCKEKIFDSHSNLKTEKRHSRRRPSRPSTESPVKGKRIATARCLTGTKSHRSPENVNSSTKKGKEKIEAAELLTAPVNSYNVNSSSCLSSPASLDDVASNQSKETFTPSGRKEKRTLRPSRLSPSLVQSVNLSGASQSADSNSADGDDAFEDYFSPANSHQTTKRHRLPHLPVDRGIHIPFELGSVLKKRKHRTRESTGSGNSKNKKTKLEENAGKNPQSNTEIEHQIHSHQNVERPLGCPVTNITHTANKGRQSMLPSVGTSTSNATKQRVSTSSISKFTERNTSPDGLKNSINDHCRTMESRGSECTAAAGVAESLSEDEDDRKQISLNPQKMAKKLPRRTLVMTSMPTEKQNIVMQVVTTLGGFSIVDRVCESTTHVVSCGQRRTVNILLGIARGCWIVSFEWILWCLEQRQWIPEEPYELSDQFPAAQICRLQRHLSAGEHQQDLFQNQPPMFVSQHSQPPTQNLVELIQLCGGTVCKSVRQAGICIGKYNGRRPEGSRVLSEQWVLDSITCLKQLSYQDYILQ